MSIRLVALQDADKADNANLVNILKLSPRTRKFIGILLLVPFVTVYALAAMVLAVRLLPGTSFWLQALYYCVAGLAWILPAAVIVWFMQKR